MLCICFHLCLLDFAQIHKSYLRTYAIVTVAVRLSRRRNEMGKAGTRKEKTFASTYTQTCCERFNSYKVAVMFGCCSVLGVCSCSKSKPMADPCVHGADMMDDGQTTNAMLSFCSCRPGKATPRSAGRGWARFSKLNSMELGNWEFHRNACSVLSRSTPFESMLEGV